MSMTCESEWFGREKKSENLDGGKKRIRPRKDKEVEPGWNLAEREREWDFGENDDKYKKYIAWEKQRKSQ